MTKRYYQIQLPTPEPIDKDLFAHLLNVLGSFTYTPAQSEHAQVILRGQIK